MAARRFFVEGVRASGERVRIDGSDAHKIAHVLRLRDGDRIDIVDSAGSTFDAVLQLNDGKVDAILGDVQILAANANVRVDVAQGLPKGQKMDFVVEKLTELGVSTIIPLVSERAVARDASDAKVDRWRRLVRAAAQQSGRSAIPEIVEPLAYAALLERFAEYDLVLLAWEAAAPDTLRAELPSWLADTRRVLVVIGPEGGLSHGEAEAAQKAGARIISLGRRILRTETAGLAVLAILSFLADV